MSGFIALTVVLLSMARPAYASDFRPMMIMFLGFIAIVFVVVFGVVWFLTRWVPQRWLRVLIRVAVIALFWTPIQESGAGYWWPLFFSLPKLLDPIENPIPLASMTAVTGLLWLLVLVMAPQPKLEADAESRNTEPK